MWIIPFLLVPVLFILGMAIKGRIPVLGGLLVHVCGPVLVLNSIDTWGFQRLFPGCQMQFQSRTYCPHDGPIAVMLGDISTLNLVVRFMLMGFGLDALAIWYLVFLFNKLRPRTGF